MKKTRFTGGIIATACLMITSFSNAIQAQTNNFVTGSESHQDTIFEYVQGPNGNHYAFGGFSGTINLDPTGNAADLVSTDNAMFLAKYDASQNFLWSIKLGEGTAVLYGYDAPRVNALSNGNIQIVGSFYGTMDMDPGTNTVTETNNSGSTFYSIQLDGNANYLGHWALHTTDGRYSFWDTDSQGNAYLHFMFNDAIDISTSGTPNMLGTTGVKSIATIKYDLQGNVVYAQTIECPTTARISLSNLSVNSQGEVGFSIFTEEGLNFNDNGANMSANTEDLAFVKLDANGAVSWRKFIFSNIDENHLNNSFYLISYMTVLLDDQGNHYTSGKFTDQFDADPNGSGAILSTTRPSSIFLIKHDAQGAVSYANQVEGTMSYYVNTKMVIDQNNFLYLSAQNGDVNPTVFNTTNGTVTMTGIQTTNTNGMYESNFVEVIDPTGQIVDVYVFESSVAYAEIEHIEVNLANELLVAGTFEGSADLDFGATTDIRNSIHQNLDLFYGAQGISTLGLKTEKLEEIEAQVYPIPFENSVNLNFGESVSDLSVSLLSMDGKVLHTETFSSGQRFELSLNVQPGVYLLTYETIDGKFGQQTIVRQ